MIDVKAVKQIREQLNLTHIMILGIDYDGEQCVATHGKSVADAKEAAELGNELKKLLEWPDKLCHSKPLERICENCSYFQRGYHRPGDAIQSNMHGQCMAKCDPVNRYEKDRACINFEPI